MGRPAKPASLIVMEGKAHRTKAEIEAREEREEKLKSGDWKFNRWPKVYHNKTANAMFLKLKKLYEGIAYVEALDENIINRYCILHAEADALEDLLVKLDEDIDKAGSEDRIKLYKYAAGISSNVNRIRDMLLKIEDRIFLNPTSRVKNVPKPKEEPKPQDDFERQFGDV